MKKYLLAAFALAAVLSGCVKDELTNGQDATIDVNAPVFYAGFADASSETKTYVNENGHLRWNADDRLTIFVGKTLNTQYAFDGEDGDNAGGFNPISDGGGFVTANPLNANYAVYPYSSTTKISEEGVISLSLPSVQTYGEDSFGRGANTMVAVTQGTDDFYLPFKNVCGYLVVSLYGDATITSVSLEGNNEEKLAGAATVTPSFGSNPSLVMKDTATETITVDCGEGVMLGTTKETATAFWFVVPQTTFSKGITITATSKDGESFQKATSKTITIERNKISSMAALEYEANYGNINFEDANFKAYCVENFDKDGDGEVSYAEAREVKKISCSYRELKSLKGVECFTALTSLNCSSNQLASLDVSKNTELTDLDCESNQLTSLDVSKNTALTSLNCSSNQLASLDVSKNTELQHLYCYSNQLTSLDVSKNTALESLSCDYNQLTSLDVSGAAALNILSCDYNQLTSLDVSKNAALLEVRCAFNQLTSLDVSNNTALMVLYCYSNQLTSLDVSGATALKILYCYSNQLSSLDVSKNIELFSFDCSPMATLKTLYISPGQSLTGVTGNRSSSIVPDATEIVVVASAPVPEAIDLGLPSGIKWASFNLGATKPEEYGGYYQWGGLQDVTDTSIYLDYSNCPYHTGYSYSTGWTKYIPSNMSSYWSGPGSPDNKTVLDPEDDVAHVTLGGNWRMPAKAEFQELKDNCTSEWTTLNGVTGRKFTSKKNGKSIFLPAAGYRCGGYLSDVGSSGFYWSSSLRSDSPSNAYYRYFLFGGENTYNYNRCYGLSVRPVSE